MWLGMLIKWLFSIPGTSVLGSYVTELAAMDNFLLSLTTCRRQGFWHGSSSGPTHAGVGGTSNRNRIHFARIYGEAQFGLLGRADYVFMDVVKQADGRFKFDMKVWKNTGGGGSKVEGIVSQMSRLLMVWV